MAERTSFPKEKISVLLLENIHPQARGAFEEEGFPVETEHQSLSEEELKERIGPVFIIACRKPHFLKVGMNAKKRLHTSEGLERSRMVSFSALL